MPPSNRFPILRLPLLPIELIAKDLELLEIFFLASCSKRIREILLNARLKLRRVRLEGEYSTAAIRISMRYGNKESYEFVLKPVSPMEWRRMSRYENDYLNIDGNVFKFPREDEDRARRLEMYEKTDGLNSKEALISISKRLSELFEAQEASFKFTEHRPSRESYRRRGSRHYRPPINEDYPLYDLFSYFMSREQSPEIRQSFREQLHYRPPTDLTSDELSRLLESCSVENFELKWKVEEGVKYRKSLRLPKMKLRKAHWLTIDCLLDMDCVSLEAHDVLLTVQDLERFIQKWLDGGLEKLQVAHLHQPTEPTPRGHFWQSIMWGGEKKPVESTQWETLPILRGNWSGFCWEIERSDGGKRAAIVAGDQFILQVL